MADETPPARPSIAKLEKLIAIANDERGDVMTRRAAKRKLALYHRHYPEMLKRTK
jgi:hypothetical protein